MHCIPIETNYIFLFPFFMTTYSLSDLSVISKRVNKNIISLFSLLLRHVLVKIVIRIFGNMRWSVILSQRVSFVFLFATGWGIWYLWGLIAPDLQHDENETNDRRPFDATREKHNPNHKRGKFEYRQSIPGQGGYGMRMGSPVFNQNIMSMLIKCSCN